MGKLAVPEYILNKPGPLTPGEFEKMKLHASVGADILSAINFPYPVVPIVRHHHENWNGRGYPDGLRGSDIPIGARILSVVDCFDALTSDRPYRPRLPDSEAIKILMERRGTMYDPLIVDTFIRVYKDIAPGDADYAPTALSAINKTSGDISESMASAVSRLDDISASTEEMLLLYEMAQELSDKLHVTDVADLIAKHLRRLVPATTCVFLVYDSDSDDLCAVHASGENASHFADIRIEVGQRLTGWVAANRQTIVNSDPMLDLGEVARALKPPLRSCLSTPLVSDNELIGALTVYSTHRDAFTEDHRRVVEVVARQVSQPMRRTIEYRKEHTQQLRDQFTGLPNREHLQRFWSSELSAREGLPCSVAVVTVKQARSSPEAWQIEMPRIAMAMRVALRGGDLLFVYDPDRLVVLLTQTDANTAEGVARKINASLAACRPTDDQSFAFRVGFATAPNDGIVLNDLVAIAEARPATPGPNNRTSIH
jgi:GGDEF domain-containing protein/putative methionine-R-sulfoxide reductase with GAF domain